MKYMTIQKKPQNGDFRDITTTPKKLSVVCLSINLGKVIYDKSVELSDVC